MSLIDTTYFVRDINVPISSTAGLNGGINDSIDLYEPEVLKKLLGFRLYKEMMTAWDAYEALESVALSDKWDALINGAEFSFDLNGITVYEQWDGLRNTLKKSLIANYVYFQHRKNNVSQFDGMNETQSVNENTTPVSPRFKMINAWNKFVDMYGEGNYLSSNDSSFYDFVNDKPSAYNFLLANISDYENWVFTPMQKISIL
jgi:hypothetical protein